MNNKVYCNNCANLDNDGECRVIVGVEITFFEKKAVLKIPSQSNKFNDCPDFKKINWMGHILRAIFSGEGENY